MITDQIRSTVYLIDPRRLSGSLVPLGEPGEGFGEVRWVKDVEVGVKQPDV